MSNAIHLARDVAETAQDRPCSRTEAIRVAVPEQSLSRDLRAISGQDRVTAFLRKTYE